MSGVHPHAVDVAAVAPDPQRVVDRSCDSRSPTSVDESVPALERTHISEGGESGHLVAPVSPPAATTAGPLDRCKSVMQMSPGHFPCRGDCLLLKSSVSRVVGYRSC